MSLTPRPTSDRAFGSSLAAAVLLLATVRWAIKGYLSSRLLIVATALGIIAVFMPSLLLPLNRGFHAIVQIVLRLTNWTVLALAYFVLVTPMALVSRATGRARHFRDWKSRDPETYFSTVPRQDDMGTMKDLF